MDRDWRDWAAALFTTAVLGALVYAGVGYVRDWLRPTLKPPARQERKIHPDFYVYQPKSHVTSTASARKLIGSPLWVKEGYRWPYEPDNRTFDPLEMVVPTGVRERGNQILLEFQKEGHRCRVPIGAGGKFFVDDMFLLKDPRELYDHWREEDWRKIERHEVEAGMTELQVSFSIGGGRLIRYSPGGEIRIIEHTLCRAAGLQPVRVTYRDGIARQIEPLSMGSDDPL